MDNHLITRNIGDLKGISTDSIFVRPPNVAEIATNVIRYPDATLAARRGYQCQIAAIGGLGNGTYHSTATDSVEAVTINSDGSLHKRLQRKLYLNYDGRIKGDISAVSNTNPCEITTSANHGLISGQQVIIRSVAGMWEINNKTYTIAVTGLDTFRLVGVDSTLFSTYVNGGYFSVAFADGRYLEFTIFTDTSYLTASLGWSLAPWSRSPWGSPYGESITCQIRARRSAIVNGQQLNVNTITVDYDHDFQTGMFIKFTDISGNQQTRTVTATSLTSVTIDGTAVSVANGIYLDKFYNIPFFKGFDASVNFTIANFINEISNNVNGIYGLFAEVNGLSNCPAAFLPITETVIINSPDLYTTNYFYWDKVFTTINPLFPGLANQSYQNSDDFENASFATFDDVVYIADGIDLPIKYDDQNAYLVGMKQGIRPSAAQGTSGNLSDGFYTYAVTYEQVDNIGHRIEGVISDSFQVNLSNGPSTSNVIVSNILSNSGYNTNCALATGGASTSYGPDVNGNYYDLVSVSAGHTMNFGDVAFYTDQAVAVKNLTSSGPETTFTVQAGHAVEIGDIVVFTTNTTPSIVQSRSVTMVTPTSITVSGNAVSVADTAQFSTTKQGLVYGNVAIVSGIVIMQTDIPVLTGHTVQLGDTLTIVDSSGNIYRRIVTAIAPALISISGYPLTLESDSLMYVESLQLNSITIQRHPSSLTSSPITLVTGAPISANLRINIWRTAQDGTLLQLLTTIPNNSFVSTQTYADSIPAGPQSGAITAATQTSPCKITSTNHGLSTGNIISIQNILGSTQTDQTFQQLNMIELNDRTYTVTIVDANSFTLNGVDSTSYTAYSGGGTWSDINSNNDQLGIDFPDPARLPNPPPISKYLLSFGNQLLYAGGKRGDPENDDNVFFSEGNLPESIPAATNYFTVPSPEDQITGMGISGTTLIITKRESLYAITGDLLTSQFQLTTIAPGSNIGCLANATIKSVGSLLYFLSRSGVYGISENQIYPLDILGNPIPLSRPIDLYFRQVNFLPQTRYAFRRAVAINYALDHQYLLFLPCEDPPSTTTQRVANTNSIVLSYDYQDKNWFVWNNMNCAGGMFMVNNYLYFQERRHSGVVGNTANLYVQHRHYRLIDHADHTSPQNIEWASSWEDLGTPMVRKKFSKCIFLIDTITDLYQYNNLSMSFYTCLDRIQGAKDTIAQVRTVSNNNNAGWSASPWGNNRWSGYQDSFATVNLKGGTVAKSIQVGFMMQTLNTDFRLSGVQLECIPENRRTVVR